MIHFCTCTGRSASSPKENSEQEVASPCKICGQKPLVYERGALSGSMLGSMGLELTGVIDPDLTWTVPKSSKRASRRARTSLTASNRTKLVAGGGLKGTEDLIDKDSKKVEDMPVSESEKLGVSILGRRFSDTIEIPIKKRKFPFVRSPSPPPQTTPCPEESKCHLKGLSASNRTKPEVSLYAEDQAPTAMTTVSTVLDIQSENFKGDADRKHKLTVINEKQGDVDFSGISILAAAACSGNIDCNSSNLENPAAYISLAAEKGPSRFVQSTESSCMPEGLGAKHLANVSVLDRKADPNMCLETHLEKNISSDTSKDIQEDFKSTKCPAFSITSEKSMDIMQNPPAKENEMLQRVETSALRDDRSHWDLNVVMDAWESPRDEPFVDAKSHATLGSEEDGIQKEKMTDFECSLVPTDLGDTKDHIKMSVQNDVDGTVVIDAQGSCRVVSSTMKEMPPFSSDSLVVDGVGNNNEMTCLPLPGFHESNEVENKHHLDACSLLDSITCSPVVTPCETDNNSPKATADVSEGTKSLHSQELMSFNVDPIAVAPVECELGPATQHTCAIAEENTVARRISFDCERKDEVISSPPVVSGDAGGDCTTHLHGPHGAGHTTDDADRVGHSKAVSVVGPDLLLRDRLTCDDQGGKASHSRSPSCGADCDNLGTNTVHEDDKYASSVIYQGNWSEDQCTVDGRRNEASCLSRDEKLVVCCRTDSFKDFCQRDVHFTEQTAGVSVDGNISNNTSADGNAIDQSKTGERSSSRLVSFVHESLNSEELPTAVTFSEDDKADTFTREEDDKTSTIHDEDMNDTETTTNVHIDPEDSRQNVNEIPGMLDTSAVMDGSVTQKVCQSNEDYHVYGSGEVALDDSFNSDYDLDDVSQNEIATSVEKVSPYHADDDSQYEDGEFRESIMYNWAEDEGEEREAEHVDYGSDNVDTDAFDQSADFGRVDRDECKKDVLFEVNHFCQEGKLDGEKNEGKPNFQPSIRGSSERNGSPIEPGDSKDMKVVKRVLRRDLGKNDDNQKPKMDINIVSELNASDKVLVGEELCFRESRHSAFLRTKSTGWDQLPDVPRSSSDAVMDVRGSSIMKNRVSCLDSSDADGSLRRMFRSTSDRELSSRIEGLNCSDASVRKKKAYVDGRSNNLDERDAGQAKSIGRGGSSVHVHGRGRVGNRWLESSGGRWSRNRHHSPGYHGPGDHAPPGTKNAAAAAAAKLESNGFVVAPDGTIVRASGVTPDRVRRQSASSPSRNLHCSLTRRESSIDRDGALGFVLPLAHGHVREMSPSRGISGTGGRSGRYALRVCATGQRERYNGRSYNNDTGSPLRIQHPLPRRQRSFSPIPGRPPHRSRSRTKSQSRSRSGSPHLWTALRGGSSSGINRGPGFRRQLSRSPNFGMEDRIRRMRSPHRRHEFPEHMIGFVPAQRNHDSPPHAPRWIDDRRGDAPDHFREHDYRRTSVSERSLPGRGFSRNHRSDLMDSPGGIKGGDYFRPMYSGRFPEFAGGVGARTRHDGSDDDRRKHGERYGMVNSVRHYEDDGIRKRFRYDVEDALEPCGRGSPRNFSRGIESRLGSGPKRDEEEGGHFRFDRERKHNANFKTFGIRDCDEDAAGRRRRPT